MADEITITYSLKSSLAGESPISIAPGTKKVTKNAKGRFALTSSVGTVEETLAVFGELTVEGLCIFENLDATHYVDIGASTGVYLIRAKPGEVNSFRMVPGITYYWKADTAACLLDIQILED